MPRRLLVVKRGREPVTEPTQIWMWQIPYADTILWFQVLLNKSAALQNDFFDIKFVCSR